jgi:hypothetical protein
LVIASRTLVERARTFRNCASVQVIHAASGVLTAEQRRVKAQSESQRGIPFTTPHDWVTAFVSVFIVTFPILAEYEIVIPLWYESTWTVVSVTFVQFSTTCVIVHVGAVYIFTHDVIGIVSEREMFWALEY